MCMTSTNTVEPIFKSDQRTLELPRSQFKECCFVSCLFPVLHFSAKFRHEAGPNARESRESGPPLDIDVEDTNIKNSYLK